MSKPLADSTDSEYHQIEAGYIIISQIWAYLHDKRYVIVWIGIILWIIIICVSMFRYMTRPKKPLIDYTGNYPPYIS